MIHTYSEVRNMKDCLVRPFKIVVNRIQDENPPPGWVRDEGSMRGFNCGDQKGAEERHILRRSLRSQRRLAFGDISLSISILVDVHPTMIGKN